jgi:hypothetical protein
LVENNIICFTLCQVHVSHVSLPASLSSLFTNVHITRLLWLPWDAKKNVFGQFCCGWKFCALCGTTVPMKLCSFANWSWILVLLQWSFKSFRDELGQGTLLLYCDIGAQVIMPSLVLSSKIEMLTIINLRCLKSECSSEYEFPCGIRTHAALLVSIDAFSTVLCTNKNSTRLLSRCWPVVVISCFIVSPIRNKRKGN